MNSIVHNTDCLEAMRQMPDKAFDLAIVDPPYGIDMAAWDSIPCSEYFEQLFRVADRQIIWGGNYFDLPKTEGLICWNKIYGLAKNPLATMSPFELAWTSFLDKSAMLNLSCSGNIIAGRVDYNYRPIHPTQKPVALYKWLLTNYAKPGQTILDTHLGSGSSRIAAYDLGFDFTGYELDKDYYDAQEKRFADHIAQPKLFEPTVTQPTQEVMFAT
jgi:site-specific DNA-methyltransferase (adenine-specific)